jgi:hypothetical protein
MLENMDPEGLERKNLQNLLDTIGRRVRWDYLTHDLRITTWLSCDNGARHGDAFPFRDVLYGAKNIIILWLHQKAKGSQPW